MHYSTRFKDFEKKNPKQTCAGASDGNDSNVHHSMMKSFMGLLDCDEGAGGPNHQDEEPFANELERWFSHAGMKLDQSSRDVGMWFKINLPLFPRIGFMARDFLGITSTSVPSECAFSKSGTTISKRRACLGDDAVQAICELQAFLNFNK